MPPDQALAVVRQREVVVLRFVVSKVESKICLSREEEEQGYSHHENRRPSPHLLLERSRGTWEGWRVHLALSRVQHPPSTPKRQQEPPWPNVFAPALQAEDLMDVCPQRNADVRTHQSESFSLWNEAPVLSLALWAISNLNPFSATLV